MAGELAALFGILQELARRSIYLEFQTLAGWFDFIAIALILITHRPRRGGIGWLAFWLYVVSLRYGETTASARRTMQAARTSPYAPSRLLWPGCVLGLILSIAVVAGMA